MSSPSWTSVLLASLVLFLCSTSSWSDSSVNPTALSRFKRGISPKDKEIITKSLDVANKGLSVFKDVMSKIKPEDITTVLKALGDFAALAPGIGAAISSIIALILIFIPTENQVMKEFAEVNRKLDSLSLQIGNLKTDVKFYSYLSAYAKHEATIATAWQKFQELSKAKESNKNMKPELQKFIKYYEDSKVETNVDKLFHYLTVEGASMSENIHNLYKEKYKCHLREMGIYYLHLFDLMFKGMALNQAYLRATGRSSPEDQTKQVETLKKLHGVQKKAISSCLKTFKDQMRKDVEEVAKGIPAKEKETIANKVKLYLDDKYSWYTWVVVVYDTAKDKKHDIVDMEKITAGAVTVAVTYTLKLKEAEEAYLVTEALRKFQKDKTCDVEQMRKYSVKLPPKNDEPSTSLDLIDFVKITDVARSKDFVQVPEPLIKIKCKKHLHRKRIYVHYSRKVTVCKPNTCKNQGVCTRLLESNEFLCDCKEGFYGERCEEKLETSQFNQVIQDVPRIVSVKDPSSYITIVREYKKQ